MKKKTNINSTHCTAPERFITTVTDHWIEQGLTSHQTHYMSYWGQDFMGQMTQPTVSKH